MPFQTRGVQDVHGQHITAAWCDKPYQQSQARLAHVHHTAAPIANLCQQNKSPCKYWGNEQHECIPAAETTDEALLRLFGPVAAVAAVAEADVDWRAEGAVMLALAKAACLVVM